MEIVVVVYAQKPAWLWGLQPNQTRKWEQVTRCTRTSVLFTWERQRTRIKVTLGITGWSRPIVHIDDAVWHLDVGSSHPPAEAGGKGWTVRPLKWYVSWVQNVARQFGPYLPWVFENWKELLLVREDRSGRTSSVPVVTPVAMLGSHSSDEITAESI